MKRVFGIDLAEGNLERLFLSGVLFTLLGAYLGNAFLSTGHGLLLIAIGWALVQRIRRAGAGSGHSEHDLKHREVRIRWSTWFLLGLVGAMGLSILANLEEIERPLKVLKKLRYHVIWVAPLFLLALRRIPFQEQRMKAWAPWLLAAWLISLSAATISGIIGMWTDFNPLRWGPDPSPARASGISGMVLTYAYSLQFSVLLLVSLVIERKRTVFRWTGRRRCLEIGLWVGCGIALAGLYLSFSRGAMLGAVAGFVALAVIQQKRWLTTGLIVAGLGLAGYAWTQKHRYFSRAELSEDQVRLSQWKTAIQTFRTHPVFGVGYRQFEERNVELKKSFGYAEDWYREIEEEKHWYYFKGHAHNDYLEAFASTGVLGGIAYLGFCACWVWEVSRRNLTRSLFLPLVIAFLASSFFQNVFTDSEVLGFLLFLYFASQISLDWEESRSPRFDDWKGSR